jgi:hypothetical protein
MQDTGLLLSLAEIAGVFVGFAALISVRGGGPSEAYEVTYVRGVVWTGLLVVVAALAPVVISTYDIGDHELWLLSSVIVLTSFLVMVALNSGMPEHQTLGSALPRSAAFRIALPGAVLWVLMLIALAAIVLGAFPDREPALYASAVVILLLTAAVFLLQLVYSQGRPRIA